MIGNFPGGAAAPPEPPALPRGLSPSAAGATISCGWVGVCGGGVGELNDGWGVGEEEMKPKPACCFSSHFEI